MRSRERVAQPALRLGLILILIPALLTGCAPDDDEAPRTAPDWVEPAWMAQVRQQDEAFQAAMIACYAEYGLEAVRSVGGGNVGFLNLADESGQIPRSIEERLEAASADCNVRVPVPEYKSSVFDDAAYRRMIELLECIAAQGFETPDPPSLEAWLESGANAASAWNPYTEMFAGSTVSDTTQEERRRLMETCPQSLPSYYVEAPDPRD